MKFLILVSMFLSGCVWNRPALNEAMFKESPICRNSQSLFFRNKELDICWMGSGQFIDCYKMSKIPYCKIDPVVRKDPPKKEPAKKEEPKK